MHLKQNGFLHFTCFFVQFLKLQEESNYVKLQPVFTNSTWQHSSIPGTAGAAAHLREVCNPGLGRDRSTARQLQVCAGLQF